jgi:CDP-diacylglycerol--glycerol-3-phosphate 3-phosphatidyltransferase
MRWSVGWFGIKDLFTMVNLFGGVLGIYWSALGHPDWAGYAILGGYLFGDSLDGVVARATGTGNRFGAEFDSAADHLGQGIAPGVVAFAAYRQAGHPAIGLALMALLMATASIRQARFNVDRFNFPLAYCGLPRTMSGIIALAVVNSVFFHEVAIGWQLGAVVLAAMAIMNLVPVPYMTHRGERKMQTWAKLLAWSFLVSPVLLFLLGRRYLFDVAAIYGIGYALFGWVPLSVGERQAFRLEYRRWAGVVDTLK